MPENLDKIEILLDERSNIQTVLGFKFYYKNELLLQLGMLGEKMKNINGRVELVTYGSWVEVHLNWKEEIIGICGTKVLCQDYYFDTDACRVRYANFSFVIGHKQSFDPKY